jgi:hypothetical protein
VNNKEFEFADSRRSEIQRTNVKHAVGLVISIETRTATAQRRPCVVAGQADVSLRNEGAGVKETFEGVEFPSLEIEFVPTKELLRRVK